MNKWTFVAASCAMSLAGVARADFEFSVDSASAGPGLARIRLFALSTGGGVDVGNRALASDITITDMSGHNLVTKFLSGAATAKADLTGVAAPDPYNSDRSFVNLLGDPSGGTSGSDNDPTVYSVVSTTPANTHANYANGVTQFEVLGANLNGGVDATRASNGGRGALIAVVVAPDGDRICFSGFIGGEKPGSPPLPLTFLCPEPATLALFAPALLLRPRRRRAGLPAQ